MLGLLGVLVLAAVAVAAASEGSRTTSSTTTAARAAPVFTREAAAVSSRCPDAYAVGRSLEITISGRPCGAAVRDLLDVLGFTTGEIDKVLAGPDLVVHSDLTVQSSKTKSGPLIFIHRRL